MSAIQDEINALIEGREFTPQASALLDTAIRTIDAEMREIEKERISMCIRLARVNGMFAMMRETVAELPRKETSAPPSPSHKESNDE